MKTTRTQKNVDLFFDDSTLKKRIILSAYVKCIVFPFTGRTKLFQTQKRNNQSEKVAYKMTAGEMFFTVRLLYKKIKEKNVTFMEQYICISKDISLRALEKKRDILEKELQKEFGSYNPTVCWQLLDDELTMQVLLRVENSGVLFGKAYFSSDVLEEGEEEYRLSFSSSLPDEPFRYSEERLEEWSMIEKKVADFVHMEMGNESSM